MLAKETGVEAVAEAVSFSPSVMSDFLRPHGLQHTSLPCLHYLREFAQTYVHWVGDAIQLFHPLLSPSPPAFNLSQHQGLFQWVSSLHQVAKVLELQLKHQSLQCTEKKKKKLKGNRQLEIASLFFFFHTSFCFLPGTLIWWLNLQQLRRPWTTLRWKPSTMDGRADGHSDYYGFHLPILDFIRPDIFYHQIQRRRMRIIIKLMLSYHSYRLG